MKDAATSSFDSIFSLIRLHKRCTFQRLHKSLQYQVVQWKAQVRQTDCCGCDSTSVSKFWNSVLQSAIDCVKEITTIRNHLFRMQFFSLVRMSGYSICLFYPTHWEVFLVTWASAIQALKNASQAYSITVRRICTFLYKVFNLFMVYRWCSFIQGQIKSAEDESWTR